MEKTRDARKNDMYRSLISGEHFIATEVGGNEVVLRQVGGEKTEEVPRKALEEFFAFEGNDTPLPAPTEEDAEISGGAFFFKGRKVETGTLVPDGVMGATESGVYLTVAAKEKGDKLDLFLYTPQEDKFSKVCREADRYAAFFNDGRLIGILTQDHQDVKLPADGEGREEEAQAVKANVSFFIGAKRIFSEDTEESGYLHPEAPFATFHDEAVCRAEGADPDKDTAVYFVSGARLKKVQAADGTFHMLREEPEDGAQQALATRYLISLGGETGMYDVRADRTAVTGPVAAITPVYGGARNALITDAEGICFTNYGHHPRYAKGQDVLDAAGKYPHLLRAEFPDASGRVTVFTLGNERYETATVRVEKTRDRGYVTKVTENTRFPAFMAPAGNLD